MPQDGDDVGTLLRLADHAMYRAKQLGRNGYQFFSVVLNDAAAAAAELADELRSGIERGELFLVYQPRIDIATRQVVGAEALLRWRHPRHGVLGPRRSCRSPTIPACSSRSAPGPCARPASRAGAGSTPASGRSRWSST